MDTHNQTSWIKRIEDLVAMLEGSTVSELELTEAGTEIIIRRQPGMVMVSAPMQQMGIGQAAMPFDRSRAPIAKEDKSIAVVAPLTGVYYASPSPTSPPFVSIGDIVQVGQVVALVEAMKVFNEIQAEVSGRVTTIVATTGEVVQKGDVLIRVQAA